MQKEVVVLIGAGSIGQAIVRRIAAGRHVVIADCNPANARSAASTLENAGFEVSIRQTDIASRDSVGELIAYAGGLGPIFHLVDAAGVSPSQASVERILRVDLYGTALLLEEFGRVMASGGSGIVVSSQSGHRLGSLPQEQSDALATTPVEELLALPFIASLSDTLKAYQYSKRCNVLRVMAEATAWGRRGATINSVSPGIVITPLANDELHGPRAEGYREMIAASPARRAGTPDEIGELAAFLLGRQGRFITGSDILIDGGTTAAYWYGDLQHLKHTH
ncbi:MAG: SDR family oxidoreductase [Alistipes sp.]|nr:SDR family oxidoreductase [Alistipes senegalensis]MCM1250374.1 SDR family oxidoreductase [Alistipes sp.]